MAAATYACHAGRQEPVAREPEPVPDSPLPASTPTTLDEPDAGAPILDAGTEAAITALADATIEAAPAAPPPSLGALAKTCRTLPIDASCGGDGRRKMCQLVLAEFDRPAAAKAIQCYAEIESACDICSTRTCTQGALLGHPRVKLAECETVQKKVAADVDESYGKVMYDLCEEYASPMTKQGRKRFVKCLRDNVGIGVRYCLWDPSATPCTENFGQERPVVPGF